MLRTILVAIDGSDHAKKALSLAIVLSSKFDARLVILHVSLVNATAKTLQAIATRRGLPKKLRDLLDTYEGDFQMKVAAAGAGAGAGVGYSYAPPPLELVEAIGQLIIARAEKAAAKAGVNKVTSVIVDGEPADMILNVAANKKADMIILGSRGLSDFKGLLLGSVSHKVSAQAECACVTVK